MSHVPHVDESCPTCRWVMSYVWMSYVPHMTESAWSYTSSPHTNLNYFPQSDTSVGYSRIRLHTYTHTHMHTQRHTFVHVFFDEHFVLLRVTSRENEKIFRTDKIDKLFEPVLLAHLHAYECGLKIIYTFAHMNTNIMDLSIYQCVLKDICIQTYIHIFICMYTCVRTWTCPYIHIYIHKYM